MKKLVHTVVGTALAASVIAGCSANEPAATTAAEETTTVPKETTVETTVAKETTAAVTETTAAVEEETTAAVEETTEAVEETTTTTIPEESIVPTTAPTTQDWTEEECPNGTAWA